jgi:hypothetical protein
MELAVVFGMVVLAMIAGAALVVVQGRRYRQEQQRIEAAVSDRPASSDADPPGGGWHGPSCSGGFPAVTPAVPTQRTGDHDRDRREPGRALAGRLLRRRGSPEPG